eukprot:m.18388 g.18388  ORF g.18388 m.18388 type:complete len:166 (-) comp10800_c0_seq1:115-612(-)
MADTNTTEPGPGLDFLGSEFVNSKGETVSAESLQGKIVGIYFSAHWCPPCRGFTPKLAEFYKSLQASGKPFEIIFVSSDRSPQEFGSYLQEMPWLAVPFAQSSHRSGLSRKFSVMGIPTFVLLRPDGTLMTKSGRSVVSQDPRGANYPWAGMTPDFSIMDYCTLL